ncbi:MAG: ABC transporter ATP-binding protein [Desulfobacterales bacterium]|nr:MAG: ABC transporter ATP-binding protein [Desulfobacterales bacterium]
MLEIENVTKSFGGLTAVHDVTFQLGDTGVTGLVGPNGSGKTTLFHLITGFYKLDRGHIHFNDKRISGLAPHVISRMGLVRTFQQTRVLPFLSVLENLMAASPEQTGERLSSVFFQPRRVKLEESENRERAMQILELLKLKPFERHLAGRLSFGQQKLIELGKVLMAKPKMILLDEPTAGVNPTLIRQLVDVIRKLDRRGIQVFLIEHNMPLVAEICEKVFVMDAGSLIFAGTPSETRQNPRVIEAYLGSEDHVA